MLFSYSVQLNESDIWIGLMCLIGLLLLCIARGDIHGDAPDNRLRLACDQWIAENEDRLKMMEEAAIEELVL